MATINIRIDDKLKEDAFAVLQELGISPSELLRQTLGYVVTHRKVPFSQVSMTDEDLELMQLAKERLANPAPRIRVTLDDL